MDRSDAFCVPLYWGERCMHLAEMRQKPRLGKGDRSSALPLLCSWGQFSSSLSQRLSWNKARMIRGSIQRPVSHGDLLSQTTGFGARNLPELCRRPPPASSFPQGSTLWARSLLVTCVVSWGLQGHPRNVTIGGEKSYLILHVPAARSSLSAFLIIYCFVLKFS